MSPPWSPALAEAWLSAACSSASSLPSAHLHAHVLRSYPFHTHTHTHTIVHSAKHFFTGVCTPMDGLQRALAPCGTEILGRDVLRRACAVGVMTGGPEANRAPMRSRTPDSCCKGLVKLCRNIASSPDLERLSSQELPGSCSQGLDLEVHQGCVGCGGLGLGPGLGSNLSRQICHCACGPCHQQAKFSLASDSTQS